MTKNEIIEQVRRELIEKADEHTKATYHRYFKEDTIAYGVKSALVEKTAAACHPVIKKLGKQETFRICEELLKSDYMEEAFVAANWAYYFNKEYEPEDFYVFEKWVENYINNWAKCDTLCNHTIGAVVEHYPQLLENLKHWARSENRWVKRAAAVTLIIPAKKGKFLKDIFEIADILLLDKDDLVQKGYGWLLKDASKVYQEDIFNYVMKHKKVMPRTALRYAIERMPAELRKQAMEK
jgi:3-methyladenine DNA glycosylase AlkD